MALDGVLMLDLLPLKHSTRPRKIGKSLTEFTPVTFMSLAAAGRSGMDDEPGVTFVGKVRSVAVPLRRLSGKRSIAASIWNIWCYLGGMLALYKEARKVRANLVIVSQAALIPMGLLLARKNRSNLVFDGRERPASVRQKGSLAAWVARAEPLIYRMVRGRVFGVIAAAPTHAEEFRQFGFIRTHVLLNVPEVTEFPSDVRQPPAAGRPVTVGMVGSLYPGRGVLELLEGATLAQRSGVRVRIRIAGFGSDEFVELIENAATELKAEGAFEFVGPLEYSQVSQFYRSVDLGAVLYEATDRAQDSLPNKLFECLASGRGVLATDLFETSALVKKFGVGLCTTLKPEDIANALGNIASNPEVISEYSMASISATAVELNWQKQASDLIQFLLPALSDRSSLSVNH